MVELDQITKERLAEIERQMLAEETGVDHASGMPAPEQVERINREMHRMARERLASMPKRFPAIPDDVMKAAEEVARHLDDAATMSDESGGFFMISKAEPIIARAIMAERERCAAIAEVAHHSVVFKEMKGIEPTPLTLEAQSFAKAAGLIAAYKYMSAAIRKGAA